MKGNKFHNAPLKNNNAPFKDMRFFVLSFWKEIYLSLFYCIYECPRVWMGTVCRSARGGQKRVSDILTWTLMVERSHRGCQGTESETSTKATSASILPPSSFVLFMTVPHYVGYVSLEFLILLLHLLECWSNRCIPLNQACQWWQCQWIIQAIIWNFLTLLTKLSHGIIFLLFWSIDICLMLVVAPIKCHLWLELLSMVYYLVQTQIFHEFLKILLLVGCWVLFTKKNSNFYSALIVSVLCFYFKLGNLLETEW